MHLSWRDFESLSRGGEPAWRRYVRFPHLLFCAKCRRELKAHGDDAPLLTHLKTAYAREETIHLIRTSREVTRRTT